jgi:hypothetical protein
VLDPDTPIAEDDLHKHGLIRIRISQMNTNEAIKYLTRVVNGDTIGPVSWALCLNPHPGIVELLNQNPKLIHSEQLSANPCPEVIQWLTEHPTHIHFGSLAKNKNRLATKLLMSLKSVNDLPWHELCTHGSTPEAIQLLSAYPHKINNDWICRNQSREVFNKFVVPIIPALTTEQLGDVIVGRHATTVDWKSLKQQLYEVRKGSDRCFMDDFARVAFSPKRMNKYLSEYGYDIHYGLDRSDVDEEEDDFGYGHDDDFDGNVKRIRELYRY